LWRFCIGAHNSSARFGAGVEATLREVVEKDKRNMMCDEIRRRTSVHARVWPLMISIMQSKRIGLPALKAGG
jgi:hypothetical protein